MLASSITGAPIYATPTTLEAIRRPETLSFVRRTFIGQPSEAGAVDLRRLADTLTTASTRLEAIASPGHCDGHASLLDAERGILFAGDSFMHTVFTAPSREVSGDDWIATLERYETRDIRTMIGTPTPETTRSRACPSSPAVPKRTR